MHRSTFRVLRFVAVASGVVAIVGATVVAPNAPAESSPRDSRSTVFEQYESLGDYAESDGRTPRAWMPKTGISKKGWSAAIEDESVRIDSQGHALYIDPLHVEHAPDVARPESATPAADVPLADAFLLNSLPGSNRTIYLDFTGHSLVGTRWQDGGTFANASINYTNAQMQMPAYDVDGDTTTFSDLERRNVIDAWSAIAEDYAPFNVNVTTADPGDAALLRSNGFDTIYGMRALITNNTNAIAAECGCGGVAYVGVFGNSNNTYWGPSLNWAQNWFSGKTISDVVSHEVGHNVGLSHDGTDSQGYYGGRDGWAPIMGVGYYEPLVQLSNGTYSTEAGEAANNPEDDYVVAVSNGLPLRTDDYGDTQETATALTNGTNKSGFISTRADVDYFSFTATATSHDVSVTSPSLSSNLDVQAELFDSSGTLLSTTNPDLFRVGVNSATGLDAVFTATTTPGETYFIALDGVGYGPGTTTGYSDYGSLGEYRINVSGPKVIYPSGTVTISGTAKVAKTLSAKPAGWMKRVSSHYQWLRNGFNIPNATSSKYKLTATDVGRLISMRLTVTKSGYPSITVTSDPTVAVANRQRAR